MGLPVREERYGELQGMTSERARSADELGRSYGFQEVDSVNKQAKVDEVFDRVAERYDRMNDFMSGGLHRLWKNAMVSQINPPRHGGFKVLDMAGGTGDIAFRLLDQSDGHADVTVFDINPSMLEAGRERARQRDLEGVLNFQEGDAQDLPFADASFDACTIAFGIRNVARVDVALEETWRVLKTGGRFVCLEFSTVEIPGLEQIYDAWSFQAIPRLGKMVAGDGEPYRYLVESIRKFPDQETFAEMIRKAGFERVSYRNLSGGIAAIHSGWKL